MGNGPIAMPSDLDLVTPIALSNIRHSFAPCDTRVTTRGSWLARLAACRAKSLKWLQLNGGRDWD